MNMERHKKGVMASLHCGLGLRRKRPFTRVKAFLSPVSWSTSEGMLRAGGELVTPEKHICNEVSVSLQISPE